MRVFFSYTLLSKGIEHGYIPALDIMGYPLLPKHWEECRQFLQSVYDDYNNAWHGNDNTNNNNSNNDSNITTTFSMGENEEHWTNITPPENMKENAGQGRIRHHTKVLVHCEAGINRSGTIVAAAMMYFAKIPLLDAIRQLKDQRGMIMTNATFQEQLVEFAMKLERQ
jgi:hypothetical protein